MQRILAYDSAIENLGICLVEYDTQWRIKVAALMQTKDEGKIWSKLEELDKILSKIINIVWLNVVDLLPDDGKTNHIQKTNLLKTILHAVDKTVGKVDVVLIENQMTPNDKTRSMSAQISNHYCGYGGIELCEKVGKKKKVKTKDKVQSTCEKITYASKMFPIHFVDKVNGPEVIMVGPSLKNKYDLDAHMPYSSFAMKYASNYTANKEHAVHNFKYFLHSMGFVNIINELDSIKTLAKNKIADIADSFMMIYAWLRSNGF